MRVLLLFLAGAAAVSAQKNVPETLPTTSRSEHRDTLDFDVRLAISGRVLLDDHQLRIPAKPITIPG
jgi:biopolymer transport protein ExbD